uniref:Cyclic phosphodiesterase n=1 Tax=Chenopodium quinoa TaxID=63459 RepID=A0A803MVC6_CHEQI
MATQTDVYSVWGLPSEDVKQRVKNVMNTLRSEFNGPDFDPHVTVVGAITLNPEDAVDKFKSACKGLKAFTAHAYMPHMSLLYADLTDEEKKKAQERANALDDSLGNLSFKINRLALYKTDTEDKTLKSWEKVMEYDLDEEV